MPCSLKPSARAPIRSWTRRLAVDPQGSASAGGKGVAEEGMTRRIRRTRQVEFDLIGIYAYIHPRSPAAAERVLYALQKFIRSLPDMPGVGTLWHSPDPRLEEMHVAVVKPYRNYLVFLRTTKDGIDIFRVIHGARELDRVVDEIELDFGGD
jgi:toxin ParE1/3/4